MKYNFWQNILINRRVFINITVFIATLFSLEIGMGYLFIQQSSMTQLRQSLTHTVERVQSDLLYENKRWNTEKYQADPETPHPTGSSGFLTPLYIVTSEGFVIERNLPIKGLLDTSDFKHLLSFREPQFVNGATNERWRVLSKELRHNNQVQGVVIVSVYNPSENAITEYDQKLNDNLDRIESKISYKNNTIDISNIDIRNIHFDVTFEIVDKFNKVLLNNGRTPSFIDPSYVISASHTRERIILDELTGEPYLIKSESIIDKENNSKGIIVAAKSLKDLQSILKNFFILSSLFNLILLIPLSLLTFYLLLPLLQHILRKISEEEKEQLIPKKISFNKKDSFILVNDKKLLIPYASNQYYLCDAIFSFPKKRWEQDELLEKLGEEITSTNWRKIYDASLAINKKVGFKLIEYKDKTYRLSPEFGSITS